jgi:hypothetical protein
LKSTGLEPETDLWETWGMTQRRFLKGGSDSLTVWSCSNCDWLETSKGDGTNPIMEDQAKDEFEKHKCGRADASQAAARIVREATEN